MNFLQGVKAVNFCPPTAIKDGAAFTTTAIDTAGFGKLAIYVNLGSIDATMAVLKVRESDDSGMASPSDVTGLVYGTSLNPETGATSALPTASDDDKIFAFFVSLQGRKRYLDVDITAGNGDAGTFAAGMAFLYDGDGINTAAERGLGGNLIK
jgi:hypothetical protein